MGAIATLVSAIVERTLLCHLVKVLGELPALGTVPSLFLQLSSPFRQSLVREKRRVGVEEDRVGLCAFVLSRGVTTCCSRTVLRSSSTCVARPGLRAVIGLLFEL